MKVRSKLATAVIAGALALSLVLLAACVSSAPTPAEEVRNQARTMTPLQIRMSESLGRMLTALAVSQDWKARPGAITLHDNVIVIWADGPITSAQRVSAKSAVAKWLDGYQGAGISILEFRDYSSGADLGHLPLAPAGQQSP